MALTQKDINKSHAGGPFTSGRVVGGPPPVAMKAGMVTGLEGKEEMLGRRVAMLFKTLSTEFPYQHDMNDALVKVHLEMVQFAKNLGKLDELVEHDLATMEPVLSRIKSTIEKTGNKEIALVSLCEKTTCHYQLNLDTIIEPGKRTSTSPYRAVLEASQRLGQFDLTEEELHNMWTVPRYMGYAECLGVKLEVSPWRDDGIITIELVD